jgi:hypothetical protein
MYAETAAEAVGVSDLARMVGKQEIENFRAITSGLPVIQEYLRAIHTSDVLDLPGKRKHTLVVASRNLQTFGSEIVLIFRHGFGNIDNQPFDSADLVIDVRSQRWCRLWRWLGRARNCDTLARRLPTLGLRCGYA